MGQQVSIIYVINPGDTEAHKENIRYHPFLYAGKSLCPEGNIEAD
jgi:hypothetical protein